MEDILDAIRRIISKWAITTVMLTADALAGDDEISVQSTKRFKVGDELLIKNADEDMENLLYVEEVIDRNTMRLTAPLRFDWLISETATAIKTIKNQFVQAIYIGEPDVIQKFPAITVNGTTRASEWYTIRVTKERFNIEIGVFVQDAMHEDGYRFLLKMTDLIQYALKRNIYPMPNDYQSTTLTEPIEEGDTVIKVEDTSFMICGNFLLIEDAYVCEPNTIITILDANTIELATPFQNEYAIDETRVIRPNRYIYNSWPADIQYGKIHKGTLLKAGVINFFCEESEFQGNTGDGFQEPQLS